MGVDPFAVLGLDRGAAPDEVAAAYRQLAKHWHPDRGGGPAAARRMAEINAAYAALRDAAGTAGAPPVARPRGPEPLRRALGAELTAALEPGEDVLRVTAVSTWQSPHTVLAVTDRRLLWLLDDLAAGRVRSLRLAAVAAVEVRRARLARTTELRVRTTAGRRLAFGGLDTVAADVLATLVRART